MPGASAGDHGHRHLVGAAVGNSLRVGGVHRDGSVTQQGDARLLQGHPFEQLGDDVLGGVNVALPTGDAWVSVGGEGRILRDQARIDQL